MKKYKIYTESRINLDLIRKEIDEIFEIVEEDKLSDVLPKIINDFLPYNKYLTLKVECIDE